MSVHNLALRPIHLRTRELWRAAGEIADRREYGAHDLQETEP
jgi:hypothetical protein